MSYLVEISKDFRARQGLPSPVRSSKGLASLQPEAGYELRIVAGISFEENQLNERGWFFDTDIIDGVLGVVIKELSIDSWRKTFSFRPTFELVAKWVYGELCGKVPQLKYVKIVNKTLGVTVKYKGEEKK